MSEGPKGQGLSDWILPGGDITLGQVARSDPRLAAALLPPQVQGEGVGVGGHNPLDLITLADTCPAFIWRPLNICATFTTTEPKTIKGQVEGIITRDLWIRKVVYTVRRPNAFAGSIFKAQSDHFNKLNPNVDFTLIVRSYFDYVISPDPTPLENIEMVFECVCPIGFVIGCAATIEADFTLRRALAADEIPYEVCITLHAITLPRRYDIGLQVAVAALAAQGVCCT
jgi:hypothetical protein